MLQDSPLYTLLETAVLLEGEMDWRAVTIDPVALTAALSDEGNITEEVIYMNDDHTLDYSINHPYDRVSTHSHLFHASNILTAGWLYANVFYYGDITEKVTIQATIVDSYACAETGEEEHDECSCDRTAGWALVWSFAA